MQEYFFANYRLLIDDEISKHESMQYLSAFKNRMPYEHTFTLYLGNPDLLEEKYQEAMTTPLLCTALQVDIRKSQNGWFIVHPKRYADEIESSFLYVMECSEDYNKMTLYAPTEEIYYEQFDISIKPVVPFQSVIRVGCETGMVFHNGFPIHASLIEKDGYGVLFVGPSGMGKSTQAKLWEKYQGAEFINGDRPGICFKDGKWYGFGMPWDGKDRIYKQKMVPIKAVVSLEQAPENHIHMVDQREAMRILLRQVMMPMWNEDAMNHLTDMMMKFIIDIPFYHLKNLPDEGAIRLTYEELWKEKSIDEGIFIS